MSEIISDSTGRVMPFSKSLEEAVLGALMLEKESYSVVSGILIPGSFYFGENERIYEAIVELDRQGKPIDMLTVTEQLIKSGKIADAGGAKHIAELTGKVGSAAHIEFHAQVIVQKFAAREAIKAATRLMDAAYDQLEDIDDVIAEAERNIAGIREKAISGLEPKHISVFAKESIERMYERLSIYDTGVQGINTGLADLNRHTNGWQKGELIIIAARPAMGKTAFALHFAKTAAKEGVPVAFFSLEMSGMSLSNRLLVSESGADPQRFKMGNITEKELNDMTDAAASIFQLPIYVDDMPASIVKIRSKARLLKRRRKCGMVIIDYLQQAEHDGKSQNREQEVAFVSKTAKNIAKELDVPVILLSQLNRGVEAREDKRPRLSDLRESGAIEQDADMVILLYRPDYYTKKPFKDENGRVIPNYIELDIAKYREGSTGVVRATHNGSLTRIFDFDWRGQAENVSNFYEPVHEQKPF